MGRVLLKDIKIKNFGPIKEDEISFSNFTFLVGRNNAGKSHYLKAVELLLSSGIKKEQISKWQNDKTQPIIVEGHFTGVSNFTGLVAVSNHRDAIEKVIKGDVLKVVSVLDPDNVEFGIYKDDGTIYNPSGFSGNLLKILPDVIPIPATADTAQELVDKSTSAFGKLKKEVMSSFFRELTSKTKEALTGLGEFLNSEDPAIRSRKIKEFEDDLKDEFIGEFIDTVPSVEFEMPNETVIAKEMKILLDDGTITEVEQKGNGLQRATLLALLKLLAKKGQKYQDHPAPIFLIGELESFLHPFAQKEMAIALNKMRNNYQIITTTHSPFIVTPESIEGYRRIQKDKVAGSKNIAIDISDIDIDLIKRHLDRRGNLEGLFADRVILIEGSNDENFYERIRTIFNIPFPKGKFTLFVRAEGAKQLRHARKFYKQMRLDDIAAVCDLDYLFSNDIVYLLEDLNFDIAIPARLRQHIGWKQQGDPSLDYIIDQLGKKGRPKELDNIISDLQSKRIFVLKLGSPEMYYKNNPGNKSGWNYLETDKDLLESNYLKDLINSLLS